MSPSPQNRATGPFCRLAGLLLAALAWLALAGPAIPAGAAGPLLSQAEKAWLGQHPVIRLGVGNAFVPIMFVQGDGEGKKFTGMVADYLDLLSRRLGVALEPKLGITFDRALAMGREKKIDLFPCLEDTPERRGFLLFSDPYLSYPLVILTRQDHPFITGLKDLEGQRVAVIKSLATHGKLVRDFPAIKRYRVSSIEEALRAVSMGRADAYVLNLAVAGYYIYTLGMTNLKVAAPTSYGYNPLCMAVRDDWPMMVGILNKALASITPAEHQAIRNKWVRTRYEHGVDWGLIWRTSILSLLVVLGVIGAFIYWNKRLAREVDERKKAQESLLLLAGGVAHNFNNLLMAVYSNAQAAIIAQDKNLPRSESREFLQNVIASVESGRDMVKRLGSVVSGLGSRSVPKTPLKLNELLQNAVRQVTGAGGDKTPGFLVSLHCPGGCRVVGSWGELVEVFVNLIQNAGDATGWRGRLAISVAEKGQELEISFLDNGPGLSRGAREHLFQPFFTTKGAGGQGLGLASSRSILQALGGELAVSNHSSGGAMAVVSLPLFLDQGQGSCASPAEPPRGPRRVLVVDDNHLALAGIKSLLSSKGHRAKGASSLARAREMLAEWKPEVVLCDFSLPDGTAWDLAAELSPDQSLVIITGWDPDDPKLQTPPPGLAQPLVLAKPMEENALFEAVDKAGRT